MMTQLNEPLLMDITPAWLADFSKDQGEPGWALDLRLKALTHFLALPWPDKKSETWKRTNLESMPLSSLRLSLAPETMAHPNGSSESPAKQDEGLLRYSLREAFLKEPDSLHSLWEDALRKATNNKFHTLALAVGQSGTLLMIKKGMKIKTPVHLLSPAETPLRARFPLQFILLDEGAEAQIWEENGTGAAASSSDPGFVASSTLIHLKKDARVNFIHLERGSSNLIHFNFENVIQDESSVFNSVDVQVGAHLFRNETHLDLRGRGAINKILGVLLGDGTQSFENWITQKHEAPQTTSDIQFRGALKGASKSFFSGLVSIVKSAQQSDAYQGAKHLLLSKDARADAIPNLEILADDVKCSHGAAVGPVDEDQKYYLETRGISPADAEKMIVQGFLEPVIAEVPSESVQDQLRTLIEEKVS